MATDLSKIRARPSRGGRGRAGAIDVGSPTVRTKRTQREVSTDFSAAERLAGLESSLGSFFGTQIQINEKEADRAAVKAAEAYRIENAEEVMAMRAEINTNFAAYREAVATGDYSKVVDKPFLDRKVVLDNLQVLTAREQAYRHLPEVQKIVDATPTGEDPRPAIEEFMKANLEGSSPLFDAEYSNIIVQGANKADEARLKGIRVAQKIEAREDATTYALSRLMDSTAVTEYDDVVTVQNEIVGRLVAGGLIEAEANIVAGEIIDTQLGQAAVQNSGLIRLLEQPDPARNGTSWIDRNPGQIEQILTAASKAETQSRSMEGMARSRQINDMMARVGTPFAIEGDSMQTAFADILAWGQEYGLDQDEYRAMRKSFNTKFGETAALNSMVGLMLSGNDIGALENTEHNKLMDAAQLMLDQGLMTPAQEENYYAYMATYGPSKAMEDKAQRAFKAGGEQAYQSYLAIKPLIEARNMSAEDFYGKSLAGSFRVMDDLLENGMDVQQVLPIVFDGREEAGDPRTYYDRTQRDKKDRIAGSNVGAATQRGRRGSFVLAEEAWSSLDHSVEWGDVPPAAKVALQDAINHAAFALRNQGFSETDIKELALQLVSNEIRTVPGLDGPTVTTQKLPAGLPDATEEAVERFQTGVNALTETDPEGAVYGDPIYDDRSSVDGSYLVSRDGTPSVAPGGTSVFVPADTGSNSPPLENVSEEDGVLTGRVKVGGDDVPINEDGSIFWSWSEGRGAWELRGRDVPPVEDDPSISVEEIEYRRIQRNLAEYNAHDVDGLLGMIGAGGQGPSAPKKQVQAEQAQHILRKDTINMIEGGVVSGGIGPMGAKRARQEVAEEPNMSALRAEAIIEKASKEVINELGDRGTLISGVTNLISAKELFRSKAYEDGNDMSVGYGFYMANEDADERLKALGYNPDKLRSGEEAMTEEDASFLRDQDIQRSLNYVRTKLASWGIDIADLANHQIQALIDLHYNAGPQMFGTGLEASFKSKDWKKRVGLEIRDKSNVSGNASQQARRNTEFNLWMGMHKPLSQPNPGAPRAKPKMPAGAFSGVSNFEAN